MSSSGTLGNRRLRIGEEWGIRSAWLKTLHFFHILYWILNLSGIWKGFSHCIGELWLWGSECVIFDRSHFFIVYIAAGRVKIIVHCYQPLRILLSMLLFFLFLAREKGRNGERPQTLYYYFPCFAALGCGVAMFFCTVFPGYIGPATQSRALKSRSEPFCCYHTTAEQ